MTTATAPATATVGTSVSLSWTVSNLGTQDATASWADVVYVSDKSTLDPSATYLDSVRAREAGQSIGRRGKTYDRTLDATAAPGYATTSGNRYLLIVTNTGRVQADSNAGRRRQGAP